MSSLQDAWEAEKTLPGSWLLGCSLDTSTLGHQDVPPSLHKWIRLENKIKTSIVGSVLDGGAAFTWHMMPRNCVVERAVAADGFVLQ